jgi:hypothetical protein
VAAPLEMIEKVQKDRLRAKPEVGIQLSAGGATEARKLEAEETRGPEWVIGQARQYLEAGAFQI